MRFVLSLSAVLTILFVCPGVVQGQVHVGQLVPDTAPGGQFSLTGDSLPDKRIEASLAREGASHTILPVAIDQSGVTFRVPDGLAPGEDTGAATISLVSPHGTRAARSVTIK